MPTFKVYTQIKECREVEAETAEEAIALSSNNYYRVYTAVVQDRWAVEEAIFPDFAAHV